MIVPTLRVGTPLGTSDAERHG
ncbi:hypothetical protein PMI23_00200, partial [Pseudomonas sp. GM24]